MHQLPPFPKQLRFRAVPRITKQIPYTRVMFALVCSIAFLAGTRGVAQCHAPNYREGQVWMDCESSVLMAVSIPLRDFAQ